MPKGIYKRTEYHKSILSKAHIGKKRSEEIKLAISRGRTGIIFSEEHKNNLSKSHMKLEFSKECKLNMSKARKKVWGNMTKEERVKRNMNFQKAGTDAMKKKFAKMNRKEKMIHLSPWIRAGQSNPSSIEKDIWKVLDEIGIEYKIQVSFNNGRFIVDIYVPDQRLIIECNGDYWHNLPERKKRDKKLRKYAMNNSYNLIELWESEIKKDPKQALKNELNKNKERKVILI